jgi:hypothetical protein
MNEIAIRSGKASSTQASYSSAFKKWMSFCEGHSLDPYCRERGMDQLVDSVLHFIGIQCGIIGVRADSLKGVHLPGILYMLTIGGGHQTAIRFKEACQSPVVKLLLEGYQRMYDRKNPRSGKAKLPFLLEMAMKGRQMVNGGTMRVGQKICAEGSPILDQMEGWRIHLALLTGIFFLLRKSEFLENNSKNRTDIISCKRNDFRFYNAQNQELPFNRIGIETAVSVRLVVQFSKADQRGSGRILFHKRQVRPEALTCIVSELESWFTITRDFYGAKAIDPIFRCQGLSPLSHTMLSSHMRSIARCIGIPSKRVTPHSLRYGGATMLAAKGIPRYMIERMGGWASGSSALDRYIQITDSTRQSMSEVMALGMAEKGQTLDGFLGNFARSQLSEHIITTDEEMS